METATGTPRPDRADRVRRDLDARGVALLRVDGGCMAPTLREGDRVTVRRASPPRRGDVALLNCSGWLEIHRLVDRIEMGPRRWFVHKGDASEIAGLAGPADILGIVDLPRSSRPAPRAHLRGMILRLGALLRHLGVPGRRKEA
jgi:hypothetical protein